MIKILSTTGCSGMIEQVISEAKEYILLVSPYLDITQPIMSRLIQADERNIKILILYGKSEISQEMKDFMNKLKNLNLYYLDTLHAKCYLNESVGLLSSLNLFEFSQVNNWEIGVSFSNEDVKFRTQLSNELKLMLNSSTAKRESFKNFELVKKSYMERLCVYLNEHFKTGKFIYVKDTEDYWDDYNECITATEYPLDYISLEIPDDGVNRIVDFILVMEPKKLKEINSKFNWNVFNEDYRFYMNRDDKISLYCGNSEKNKWHSYSDKIRFQYISEAIKRVTRYIKKVNDEVK